MDDELIELDEHTHGTSWYGLEVAIEALDGDGNSTPADLTGCESRLRFFCRAGADTPTLELDTSGGADGMIVGNVVKFDARLPAAFSLEIGSWYWDNLLIWPTGHIDPVAKGTLEVVK
jgi:hypothetical protein